MRNTIKNHKDFLMDDADPCARCGSFLIRAKPARFPDDPRFGLVATKKTLKLSVDRNRARRLLRDWIAFNQSLMRPDMDYVFIVRRSILGVSRNDGRVAMKKGLHYNAKTAKNGGNE